MNPPAVEQQAIRRLWDYVQTDCGVALGEDALYALETRLKGLLLAENCADFSEFLSKVHEERSPRLRDLIAEALCTGESSWFRDGMPFKVFREHLLPAWAAEWRAGDRQVIRVWSTACATGQEPYSLAMVWLDFLRENDDLDVSCLEILGTDLSVRALERAQTGRYSHLAMEPGLPAAYRKTFFEQEGRNWRLLSRVRERVRFEPFNLADNPARFGRFDAVFSRYVACYYSDEFKRRLYRRLKAALRPGGCLFLGAAEILGSHAGGFELAEHGNALFYRAK